MHLSSLTLTNFRCFGSTPICVELEPDLSCFIGANASGKTAVFQALNRLFGVGKANRSIVKEDFHLNTSESSLANNAELVLDVVLSFPELADATEEAEKTVPAFFSHFVVEATESLPQARIQLKAIWEDDGTQEGNIAEDIRWLDTLGDDYEFDTCRKVSNAERAAIQLIYVPAKRNAVSQAAAVLKSRLWQIAQWSSGLRKMSSSIVETLQLNFAQEEPVKLINTQLTANWQSLHSSQFFIKPEIQLLESSFESLLKNAAFMVSPDEQGADRPVSSLSDGQASLFYLALVATVLQVETEIAQASEPLGFNKTNNFAVALTLIAIEEPENNLSPFYLARIIKLIKGLVANTSAQVCISSHSPALVGRIEPKQIRYLRYENASQTSSCRKLTLPEDDAEAAKYVRLAVQAYPELYFANFVILAEGASEQIILPKLADALGYELDPSFVPVVPLNGRYVEHFWQLLNDLKIPFATLVDLDLGRAHGGVALLNNYAELLEDNYGLMVQLYGLQDKHLLANSDHPAIKAFQDEGLFFSNPIDIDFSMLAAFTEEYKASLPKKSKVPKEANYATAIQAVVKTDGNAELYSKSFYYTPEQFAWYRYLFLGNSKPDSHLKVLSAVEDEELRNKVPKELKALIEHAASKLNLSDANAE